MNRLIIIGNGFDIAHGLKSRFSDFIHFYFSRVWHNLTTGEYNNDKDPLIIVSSALEFFKENDLKFEVDNAHKVFKKIYHPGSSYHRGEPRLSIHSNIFKEIFEKYINGNWFDIETEYYNELTRIIEYEERKYTQHGDRVAAQKEKLKKTLKLNQEVNYIEKILLEHLKFEEEEFSKNPVFCDYLQDCFYENIYYKEDNKIEKKDYTLEPEKVQIVNFNYTNIASRYKRLPAGYIHIHGSLSDNPIFGFGDDTSDKYKELENEYNNEFLRKIKSFKYLRNSDYKKLLTFINSGDFQVHIYGHSCGVSDRTLFKQIFENKRCKHIKTFYYDQKDFEEKMFEISRHFENKNEFLEKIVSFDHCRPMPQPDIP
ncbi:AbiH family protein [Lentimicrobium sp. S6]|uniref:AbiH family protein n=1 Tax=Lentimicrobium sp. S6 TaxID=2735872 RepID=UPI001553057F|nr:AbiH family protein [Lentimicrobium sp. S6]NPD47804.1 hypothetical protein [Lentimicrobium sp. S6]